MSKKNSIEKLKEIKKFQKEQYKKEVDQQINTVYGGSDYYFKFLEYKEHKRLKLINWLIILMIFVVGALLSVLVGYLTLHNKNINISNWKGINWFSIPYTVILFLISFIIGYIRNRKAMDFYNDRRRRYQKTLTVEEAKLIKIKNHFLISSLLMFIYSLTLFLILGI